jgi:hypothetical protein
MLQRDFRECSQGFDSRLPDEEFRASGWPGRLSRSARRDPPQLQHPRLADGRKERIGDEDMPGAFPQW